MSGVATPTVLLSPGDDPHDFTLRPSQARTLSQADIVIWVGPSLTPWLRDPLANLAGDAQSLALLETEGWDLLATRDVDDHHEEHDEHEDHDDHEEHDEHEDHDDHEEHDHGPNDPHAWLDPSIVSIWATNIAEVLTTADPEHADQYTANLTRLQAELTTLTSDIAAMSAEIDGSQIILPHDSYQYFEVSAGITPAAFISNSEDTDPGAGHLRHLREMVVAGDVTCVLHESPTDAEWANVLIEDTDAQTARVDVTDRAGVGYVAMMNQLATTLRDCAN
jgi:zinc transport system substrate-binding protein